MSDKKDTRMMQLFEGVPDGELQLFTATWSIESAKPSWRRLERRLAKLTGSELERRRRHAREVQEREQALRRNSISALRRLASEKERQADRWSAFTDEEIEDLRERLYGDDPLGSPMFNEVDAEYQRRREEDERPVYQGPGWYVDRATHVTYHVVGQARSISGAPLALVGDSLEGELFALPVSELEARDGSGRRVFTYHREKP